MEAPMSLKQLGFAVRLFVGLVFAVVGLLNFL